MNCDCGNKLNSYNKDGICNECVTENKLVTIRFVDAGPIYECWALMDYLRCLEFCEEHNMSYNVIEYQARASRVVNVKRLIRAYQKGEDIDLDDLIRDLTKIFMIDVIGAIKEDEEESISCSKMIETFEVWKNRQ